MVSEIKEMIKSDPNRLDRKRLEQIRGFLIHVVRTYPSLKPYLQGLHLTIDGWRDNRDKEGYKIAPKVYEEMSARRNLDDKHMMSSREHKEIRTQSSLFWQNQGYWTTWMLYRP